MRPRSSWSTVSDDVWNSRDDEDGPSEPDVWVVNRLSRMAACMSPSGMSGSATTVAVVIAGVVPGAVEGGGRAEDTGRGRDDCICKISSAFLEMAVERSCCPS